MLKCALTLIFVKHIDGFKKIMHNVCSVVVNQQLDVCVKPMDIHFSSIENTKRMLKEKNETGSLQTNSLCTQSVACSERDHSNFLIDVYIWR